MGSYIVMRSHDWDGVIDGWIRLHHMLQSVIASYRGDQKLKLRWIELHRNHYAKSTESCMIFHSGNFVIPARLFARQSMKWRYFFSWPSIWHENNKYPVRFEKWNSCIGYSIFFFVQLKWGIENGSESLWSNPNTLKNMTIIQAARNMNYLQLWNGTPSIKWLICLPAIHASD